MPILFNMWRGVVSIQKPFLLLQFPHLHQYSFSQNNLSLGVEVKNGTCLCDTPAAV